MIKCALILLALIITDSVIADPVPLAETDLGPITTADLEYQVSHHLADLRDGDLESAEDWDLIPDILRQTAHQQILLHLAEERGLLDGPVFQTRLETEMERVLLGHAVWHWIDLPSRPTREELQAEVDAHRAEHTLPPRVSWRFMLFEASATASPEERAAARERAHLALGAIASGEPFEEVATRLATPPASGEPGALVGPVALTGQMLPEVEEALHSLPLGEISEPIETPIGLILLQVESRELERFESDGNLRWVYGQALVRRRFQEFQDQLVAELRERHPVEIIEPLTADMPDETPALRVGDRTLTLNDLRRRAELTDNPEATLALWLTPQGREALVRDQLLLCEMEATGLAASPEFEERMAHRRRTLILEDIEPILESERIDAPTQSEIEAHWESHRGDFETDLYTVRAIWFSNETLARLASSELGLDLLREAQELRRRWIAGEESVTLLQEIGIDFSRGDGGGEWISRPIDRLPGPVRDAIASLEPGEYSDVQFLSMGVLIVHLSSRERGIPSLEDVQNQVRSALMQSRAPETTLMDDLLEEYHYRQTADVTRLRWDASGEHIIALPAPE